MKWINCEERLPDKLREVLCHTDDSKKWRIGFFEDGTWFDDDTGEVIGYTQKSIDGYIEKVEGVMHWTPLPP